MIFAKLALLGVLLLQGSPTGTLAFAWDANAPNESITHYTLWEEIGGQYVEVIDIPGNETTVEISGIPPGVHVYALTADNIWGTSPYSNQETTAPAPSAPGGVTISISIQIQVTPDEEGK